MIIANWKMNGTSETVKTWIEQVSNKIDIKPDPESHVFLSTCFVIWSLQEI